MPCRPLNEKRYPPTQPYRCEQCGFEGVAVRGELFRQHTRRGSVIQAVYQIPRCDCFRRPGRRKKPKVWWEAGQ